MTKNYLTILATSVSIERINIKQLLLDAYFYEAKNNQTLIVFNAETCEKFAQVSKSVENLRKFLTPLEIYTNFRFVKFPDVEQNYEISSPLSSLFSVDLLEELNNEISSNDEFEHMFNEILNNDNTSDIYFEDFEESQKNNYEQDQIIDNLKCNKFTPYIIIDFIKDAIKKVDEVLSSLGIYDTHFQFDNKYLHKSQNKQLKNFSQRIIQWRRCIFCNKYIAFFSRSEGCILHSWYLNNQSIQVPCIGQYTCEALQEYLPVCKRTFNDINLRQKCLCC
ncbi:hypothetical protein Glove_280g11 [Diversispora epigaea]|uniref:Uncharacterized protein n=1 Tax=Diversispora epigaea TaxID=1348612 RepID=A0A397I8J8_9GLOM|nr:hypothetical protein Glove_280g11 [Diversispora epigaea]